MTGHFYKISSLSELKGLEGCTVESVIPGEKVSEMCFKDKDGEEYEIVMINGYVFKYEGIKGEED